jgi:tetratricopeptide (TPR) repeat protein
MKKKTLIVLMFTIWGLQIPYLHCQLSKQEKESINQEVKEVIRKNALVFPTGKTNEEFLKRNLVRNKLKVALQENRQEVIQAYFNEYKSILDTLTVSNPVSAKEISNYLTDIFDNNEPLQQEARYYSILSDYYLGLYDKSLADFRDYIQTYPTSKLQTQAITMLLKSALNSQNENPALEIIQQYGSSFNDEQNYLSGHIYYALERDALAESQFLRVKSGTYSNDANRMITLINLMKPESTEAEKKLLEMYQSEPGNPFILLALARVYSNSGNWSKAEEYYNKYASSNKSYRELQVLYELAITYLNMNREDQAIALLNKALADPKSGEYICPILQLWADLTARKGDPTLAIQKTETTYNTVTSNNKMIAEKLSLVQNFLLLKNTLGTNPNLQDIKNTVDNLSSIARILDSLNTQISNNPMGISLSYLSTTILLENQILGSYAEQLHNYITADRLKNVQDTLHVKQLESLENIYSDQLRRIEAIRLAAIRLNNQNTKMAIRNEIDNNLDLLNKILISLYQLKTENTSRLSIAQIDSLISYHERKKSETAMLLDYYDYDNSGYRALLSEIDESNSDTVHLLNYLKATKSEVRTKFPQFIARREKRAVLRDMADLNVLIPEYTELLKQQQTYLEAVQTNIEFTKIHVAFLETMYYDRQKLEMEQSLSYEENQKLFVANQVRKLTVFNRAQDYVNMVQATDQTSITSANPNMSVIAGSRFIMGELGSSLWPEQIDKNLKNYKLVLEADPGFYLSDAVLYNIGFLSSIKIKDNLDKALLRYESSGQTSLVRPYELRNTETAYKESIDAYRRIVDEFPDSRYHSEALFRLGNLYIEIGSDAERPIQFYEIARDYYNRILDNSEDPYYYKALYQRGWTWLNSSSEEAYKKGIADFAAILNAIDRKLIIDETEIIDYSVTSIKNIGYCLVGLDGADNVNVAKGALYVKSELMNQISPDNINLILDESVGQKLKLYLPMQAIDYMKVKLEQYPLALENPILADSICALYKRYPTQINRGMNPDSLYFAEKERIIRDYGYNSEWYNHNKNSNIDRQILVVMQALIESEKHYNNKFVDNPTVANFEKYLQIANQFQKLEQISDARYIQLDTETQSNVIAQNLRLARLTNDPKHYLALAARIYKFNDKTPGNSNYFNLEGTAYDCARIVVDSMKTDLAALKASDPGLVLPLSDQEPSGYYRAAAERFANVLLSDRFKSLKNDRIFVEIISRQAELAAEQKQYELSISLYRRIVDFEGYVQNDVKRSALISIGDNYEALRNYAEAEKWYRQAENYAINQKDKNEIHLYALLQIQNGIDAATAAGNYAFAADEYLRLAQEYRTTDPTKNLQYKGKAQIAYLQAGNYRRSISLLLDISSAKSRPDDIFNLYRLAWSIADSVGYRTTADSLKHAFISRFPSGYEAYQTRLSLIDNKASSPSTAKQAGDMYIALYEDVMNKKIDAGDDNPGDLFMAAISMFDQADVDTDKESLAEQFIAKYPQHSSTIRMMEYLADRKLAAGDTLRYEQLARQIFFRDKTNQSRYANTAKFKLSKLAAKFQTAYEEKNWQDVNTSMAEFRKLHQAYDKEGLKLDFTPVYNDFKIAESEYSAYRQQQANIRQYNQQLAQFERGFLTKKPHELVSVNSQTRWNAHLAGPRNRLQNVVNTTGAEVRKAQQYLATAGKLDLDAESRLKGFDLIARIADHGSDAIDTQITRYMNVSREFAGFKRQYQNALEELYAGINTQKTNYILSIQNFSYPYNLAVYKYFYLPGCRNQFSVNAYDRLNRHGLLPDYTVTALLDDKNWQISCLSLDNANQSNQPMIQETTEIAGHRLTRIIIPPDCEIVMQNRLEVTEPYLYGFANLISPYVEDTAVSLNGQTLAYVYNPVDTLMIQGRKAVLQSLVFGENEFVSGVNNLEIRLRNYNSAPLPVYLYLSAVRENELQETESPVN